MRTTNARRHLLALALAASLALTACGGDDGDSSADEPAQESSSSTTDEGTDEGTEGSGDTSEEAPSEDAPEESEPPAEEEGGGDKPSREDVIAGYTSVVTEQAGGNLPAEIVEKTVTCFVDELYDDASATTLQAIADADPTGIDPADGQLFADAGAACAQVPAG